MFNAHTALYRTRTQKHRTRTSLPLSSNGERPPRRDERYGLAADRTTAVEQHERELGQGGAPRLGERDL